VVSESRPKPSAISASCSQERPVSGQTRDGSRDRLHEEQAVGLAELLRRLENGEKVREGLQEQISELKNMVQILVEQGQQPPLQALIRLHLILPSL